MRLIRITSLLITIVMICSFFISNIVVAEDTIDNIVFATFNLDYESATDIDVSISMEVERITTDFTYTADEIKIAGQQEIGAFRLLLFQMLRDQVEEMFPNAELNNFIMPEFEDDTNIANSNFSIILNKEYFNLNDSVNAHNYINGLVEMGAIVNYSLGLYANEGWNNTYYVAFKNGLTYKRTSGVLTGDRHKWMVNNWNGEQGKSYAEIELKKKLPATAEEIFIDFKLDTLDVDSPNLETDLLVSYVSIDSYEILPDYIYNLDYVPADGLRLFVENKLITWDEIYNSSIKPIEQNIKNTIEGSIFNQDLDFTFSWDASSTTECETPYNISDMNAIPEIKCTLFDPEIILKFHGITGKALFGLLNSGANANLTQESINFGRNFDSINHNYNITLILPEGFYIENDNIYTWNNSQIPQGNFKSDNVKLYPEQDIDSSIEIDMASTDLNLASFLTGTTELMVGIDMNENRNFNVVKVPSEFSIPDQIKINNLCSDAFRVCVQEDVFSTSDVDTFLKGEKTIFESRMRKLLTGIEISADINRATFDDSINSWDGNITDMDDEIPVEVGSYAHSSYPMSFDLGLLPPKFEIPTKDYDFSGIQNQDVTYKIVFPSGIDAEIINSKLGKSEIITEEGRDFLQVKINATDANQTEEVSIKLVPSALFIIGTFMPCIIAFIITIIFIIVIIIIRRKKKGRFFKLRKRSQPEEEYSSYEGEDYYIPPPPGSKE